MYPLQRSYDLLLTSPPQSSAEKRDCPFFFHFPCFWFLGRRMSRRILAWILENASGAKEEEEGGRQGLVHERALCMSCIHSALERVRS